MNLENLFIANARGSKFGMKISVYRTQIMFYSHSQLFKSLDLLLRHAYLFIC